MKAEKFQFSFQDVNPYKGWKFPVENANGKDGAENNKKTWRT